MKKLLITNLVTAIVVLGIIAAYSFKPEQKAGARYATITIDANLAGYAIIIVQDGKSEEINSTEKFSGKRAYFDLKTSLLIRIHEQLEKMEASGYQLENSTISNINQNGNTTVERTTYTLRKP